MKIYLDTIGCRLNQSEIESYAMQFRYTGHVLVASPSEADLAVVNTCAVTVKAAADSRKKIRSMKRAGVPRIVVTGCWSTLDPQTASDLVGVDQIVMNIEKEHLVPLVLNLPHNAFDTVRIARKPIPGIRLKTRAFIKVQDGCDNHCTYCVTTIARGSSKSRPAKSVIREVEAAVEGGANEVVLTGVHMGSWGKDFSSPVTLNRLVKMIIDETDIPRLRLSSLEPWDIDKDFCELWQDGRLARHFHLPLQSGSGVTLKRMARKITPVAFAELLMIIREAIPDVAITTDIIVGFPGETSDDFKESLAFVKNMNFARGHVFTYSERPGTPAANMSGCVPFSERKSRNALMREVVGESENLFQRRFLGKMVLVLWENARKNQNSGWTLNGLTDNYLRVKATSSHNLWNKFSQVKLTGIEGRNMTGQIEE
jgi:threonylcarbamoyladenosine tRNA methylthiotransferase MtaB